MNEKMRNSIKDDIETCSTALKGRVSENVYEKLYAKYRLLDKSIDDSIPNYVHAVSGANYHHELAALKSILETYLLCDSIPAKTDNNSQGKNDAQEKIIFLSHKSDDKKYGDALRDFIIGLGVKDEQLIYTSHPLNKIPMDENIYEYLRKHINSQVFMIILWSNKYLESPACLNEMGAAWVTQADYTNIYVPDFSFGDPKYHECAVDTRKMGAVLNGDEHCKASMIEFKNKIVKMFELEDNETKTSYLLDKFIESIKAEESIIIDGGTF
jgi:hypothetical protein